MFERFFGFILLAFMVTKVLQAEEPDYRTTFENHYSDWVSQTPAVSFSSRVEDYIMLPGFRSIVAMGLSALPFLRQKLSASQEKGGPDFMLAHAVVEICNWKEDFETAASGQELRDRVLARMRQAIEEESMRCAGSFDDFESDRTP